MSILRGLAWLLLLQSLGELLQRALHLPVPGPVLGMALALPFLRWEAVRTAVGAAAERLLAHLSLLFVPIGVGVVTHLDTVQRYGLRLAAVIVVSTWVGLAVTALVLRLLLRGEPSPAPSPSTSPLSTTENRDG